MRIQTWHLAVQIKSDGEVYWTLSHSLYGKNGRQIPRQLAAGDIGGPRELHATFDTLADMIRHAYVLEDGGVQLPLPLGEEVLR